MAAIKTIQENEEELWKTYTPKMNEKIAESDAIYDKQIETIKKLYDGKIQDAEQSYEELSRQNEVQKFINVREVAENNANLGLTDSGLNRTQQTAVQLSASNNAAKIERQRQSMVDELKRLVAAEETEIEGNKSTAQMNIRSGYEDLVNKAAVAKYEADWEAETARIQAEIEAETARRKNELEAENERIELNNKRIELNNKGIYGNGMWTNTGTQDEYGNPVWRSSDGKTQAFAKGINPYTGTINKDIHNGANTDNGYQPDNINGDTLKLTGMSTEITGKKQAIWTVNGKYYVWFDNLNTYQEVDLSDVLQ